jgi:hypothetical protein
LAVLSLWFNGIDQVHSRYHHFESPANHDDIGKIASIFDLTERGAVFIGDSHGVLYEWGNMREVDNQTISKSFDVTNWSYNDWGNTVYFIVWALYNDFKVDSIRAVGEYTPLVSPSPVPEPSTMLLLGFGIIGLAGIRRKFRKS